MEGLVQMLNKKSSTNFENLQELKKAMTKPIVLLGMMGSGKSTVAKELSRITEFRHIDIDEQIEIAEGMAVSEIFASKGEEYFRELESRILKEVVEANPSSVIISLGGGAPCFFDNMDFINQKCMSFFLNANHDTIIQRLLNPDEQAKRPLLGETQTKLINAIYKIYDDRFDSYLKAQFFINGNEEPAIAADKIWVMAQRQ
jgi:shikimate kinase